MPWQFTQHYTRDEARALLPQIRQWLEQLSRLRVQINQSDQNILELLSQGRDLGGKIINDWIKLLVQVKDSLAEFQKRDIQVKDLDRGLLDFPAFIAGKEVFLCWEKDEDDIEFWHDLDTGYAGRERLD